MNRLLEEQPCDDCVNRIAMCATTHLLSIKLLQRLMHDPDAVAAAPAKFAERFAQDYEPACEPDALSTARRYLDLYDRTGTRGLRRFLDESVAEYRRPLTFFAHSHPLVH